MRINIITTIAIISIVTLALLIISGVSRESLIDSENYRLVKEIDRIATEGNSIKQKIKNIPTSEIILEQQLSAWREIKIKSKNILSDLKKDRQLDIEERNKRKEALAKVQDNEGTKKMTYRRKFFLSHGYYPENHKARIQAKADEARQLAQRRQQLVQQKQAAYDNWLTQPTATERYFNNLEDRANVRSGANLTQMGRRLRNPELIKRGLRVQRGLETPNEAWNKRYKGPADNVRPKYPRP